MFTSLCYTGCTLDRAATLRRDEAWYAARLRDPRTKVVPVWHDHHFVSVESPPRAVFLVGRTATLALEQACRVVLLGVDDADDAWLAADLSGRSQAEAMALSGEGASRTPSQEVALSPLRRVGAALPAGDAAVLAYARGILHWHRRHLFCGVCGAHTGSRESGHLRVCGDSACAAEHFPRTDPAVIMLVTRRGSSAETTRGNGADDQCLLARQARWPRGMYSTLAGFVEPGETLEEAVARETREETGIDVGEIRYRGSQPWPFPASIMLGFRAEAAHATAHATAIAVAGHELEDARWFTRTEVASFDDQGLRLPSPDSIARRLIVEWLEEAG